MRRSEGIGLRLDAEMREAISDLGHRLGTDNVSSIVRIGFMSGYKALDDLPDQLLRQAFKEGVTRGLAAFKENLTTAVAQALEDIDDGRS